MSLLAKFKSILAKIKFWSVKKKLIVGTIVFVVIAVGVTTGLIIWRNSQSEDKVVHYNPNQEVGKKYPDESHLLIKDLSEIYHTNSLDWISPDYGKDGPHKISGLKNKTVENKINQEIAATIKELKSLPKAKGAETSIGCDLKANFANVLSITCYRHDSGRELGDGRREDLGEHYRYLNYRLSTGEHLKFTDIFTAGTNYNQVVTEAYNYTSAINWSKMRCLDDEYGCEMGGLYEPTYSADYEEEIVKFVTMFKKEKDIKFFFNEKTVVFVVGDKNLIFNFEWNYKQVAIYKRFAYDAISYDNNDNERYGFVFTYAMSSRFGQIKDGVFVDCAWWNYLDPSVFDSLTITRDAVMKKQLEIIESKIRELKPNSNQAIVFNCIVDSWDGREEDPGFRINVYTITYRMSREYYAKTVFDRLIESCHHMYNAGACANPYYRPGDWNGDKNITHDDTREYYFWRDNKWVKETDDEYNARIEQTDKDREQKRRDDQCASMHPGFGHYDSVREDCVDTSGNSWWSPPVIDDSDQP